MARRNVLLPYQIASAEDLSTDFQTAVTNVQNLDKVVYKVVTSGVTDNTGTFGVQVRDTRPNSPNQDSGWIDLTFDAAPVLNDDNSAYYIEANVVATEARLIFTAAGGTPDGTAEIWVSGTQIGG